MNQNALFIVGPTGSGKSDIALTLAKRLNGEIISCDSMQVYRGMDIGTAKPSKQERKLVRHHLIDVFSPRSECSVYRHRQLALQAVKSVLQKKRVPILVGGSGFYVKSIVEGIGSQPGKDNRIREKLKRSAKKFGAGKLFARLKKLDPKRAKAIHPNDERRVIRALEIWELSKKKPSAWHQKEQSLTSLGIKPYVFGVSHVRSQLYDRINGRVDDMVNAGWLKEVKRLKRKGFSKTARAAIGYAEMLEVLGRRKNLCDAADEIKKKTRHFAKRQLSWFRRDRQIQWIPVKGSRFAKSCAREIEKRMTHAS